MRSIASTTLSAAASLLLSGTAFAQTVHFQSTPVKNLCPAPFVITMTPAPAVWIAPNAALVMNKVVNNFQTPHGWNFVPAGNHAINPGNLCLFDQCGPASITLTCVPIGADPDKNVNIVLYRMPGEGKAQAPSRD